MKFKTIFIMLLLIPISVAFSHDLSERDKMMEVMKLKGCMFSGLLSGVEDQDNYILMLGRSKCEYLPRAVETWNTPPNFQLIRKNMNKIYRFTGRNYIYGMFIAESIDTRAGNYYYYPYEKRYFNFAEMCREGTEDVFGKSTCMPSMDKEEYRKYLKYIMANGIDIGIREFLYGQIYFQDPSWEKNSYVKEINTYAKNYAASKGVTITIGAQTNDIATNYLRNFDYISGGTAQDEEGKIEYGKCLSTQDEYCHGLLWNKAYTSKANNVIMGLDWSSEDDDANRFASLSRSERAEFLEEKYEFFTTQDIGFYMPYRIPLIGNLHEDKCHGPSNKVYSADNKYYCRDENVINNIFGKWLFSDYFD